MFQGPVGGRETLWRGIECPRFLINWPVGERVLFVFSWSDLLFCCPVPCVHVPEKLKLRDKLVAPAGWGLDSAIKVIC